MASMAKVTSGEFQREFGRYRALAQREAVVITNHGRDDVVLLGAEDYARLRRYETIRRRRKSKKT
jgi:prevent-host-death family protein